MPERYAKVDPATLQERERKGGGAASRDLGGALGAENIAARVWRFGPGHEMAYHRHRAQEEFYHLVSGVLRRSWSRARSSSSTTASGCACPRTPDARSKTTPIAMPRG